MLSKNEFYESTAPGVYIYPAQPGVGKTLGLIEYIKSNSENGNPLRIAVFSNNHDHLSEIEKGIPRSIYSHLRGFTKICPRKDDPDVKTKYKTYGNPKDNICEICGEKSGCQYLHQFKFLLDDDEDEIQVILAPLEFLSLDPVTDYINQIFIDESVEKLDYLNIGVSRQSKLDMCNALELIGYKTDIGTELLCKQIERAYEIINKFQVSILKQASLLITEKKSILENFNIATYSEDEYVIQNGRYITRPANVKPVIGDKLRKMIHAFYSELEEYNENLSEIIKADSENTLPSYFINFPAQINAIQELERIYGDKQEQPFPININEKIEDSLIDASKGLQYISYEKEDGTYLVSTIGKQYASNKAKRIELQQDSYLTFGVHMMHTVFELAETYPVKLLDSSFNETCFDKLYNENQNNNPDPLPVYIIKLDIAHNPESRIYPMLTRRNKYLSNYSKSVLGIAGDQKPSEKCLRYIKDINAFGRQAKREGKTVAVITFKELEKYFIEPFGKKMVKHFGRFRGSNTQEHAVILIVFGTMFHPSKTVLLDYISTFHEFPKDITPIKDAEGKFIGYVDKELNEFFQWHVMEEMYQAIHRIRPLQKNKGIILFGKMPQRIIDNKECTIEEPHRFSTLQAKLLDRKSYYLKHPEEARKFIIPEKLDYDDYEVIRDVAQDGARINLMAYKLGLLSREEMEEIIHSAFKPIMNSVMKAKNWNPSRKKPLLDAVTESVYDKSRSAKRKKRGLKGYSREEIHFAITYLEKQGIIEVKKVSLNDLYHDTKRGEDYLIIFKN